MPNAALSAEQGPMLRSKLAAAALNRLPIALQRKLRSPAGRRLLRFAPAALVALAASQITYFICTNVVNTTGRVSGLAGWLAGAVVSYATSRWAWERRGRPPLLQETLPFIGMALVVGVVLTEASHFAYRAAQGLGLHGVKFALFTQTLYITANFVTFCLRFLILNTFIFAGTRRRSAPAPTAMIEAD